MLKLSKDRIWAILLFIAGTILIGLIYIYLPAGSRNIINAFTLFGTFLSLFGIAIAYLQIQSINITSKQTKLAVEKSLIRINQILSVSELSKANKIIQEVQTSLISEKHELSLLRMKDLKEILIQVKYNSDLLEYTTEPIYQQNIIDLGSDIINLHEFIIKRKKSLNFNILNRNLENLATTLIDFENKLKYKAHDTGEL